MTTKETAIREVILKRKEIITKAAKKTDDPLLPSWYDGRATGLMDVYVLLSETEASIRIEL